MANNARKQATRPKVRKAIELMTAEEAAAVSTLLNNTIMQGLQNFLKAGGLDRQHHAFLTALVEGTRKVQQIHPDTKA